jgi:hypothetical protein
MTVKLPPVGGDPKKAGEPKKGFDPKSVGDGGKRGRANFVDKKQLGRPFKGGGRGR